MSFRTGTPTGTWRSLRAMVAALVAVPAVICLAMWFALSPSPEDQVPWVYIGAIGLLGVVEGAMITQVGYRAAPLPAGLTADDAASRSRAAFRTGLFLRVALAEIPLLVSLAVAFAAKDGGFYVALSGAVITSFLMLVHGWPTANAIDRVAANLEQGGTRSHLRESLGLQPR